MKALLRTLFLLVVLALSCDGGGDAPDSSQPTDGDADVDADSDVDGDVDGDSDSDADSDSDGDVDGDSDADADEPPTTAEGVWYVGRHDDSAPEHVRFGWPGTGLLFAFEGTSAAVTMTDPSGYFTVVVDGEVQPTLVTSAGERSYDLATGLASGQHRVELYRRPEGFFGPTVVASVTTDGDLVEVTLPRRRMEVIGDSITCGYGNEGPDRECDFSAGTENHYQTYAAMAARRLDAELHAIAWSGKGMVYNYGADATEPMPEIYDRTIPSEAGGAWSFDWQPQVVLINLGTNDFSTDGDPTEEQFVGAYVAFLERLRGNYPGALILCAVAPLLGGTDGATAEAYIQSAVTSRNDGGDPLVDWLDLTVENIGWGCDWHPSVATHEAMADLLVTALETELGW